MGLYSLITKDVKSENESKMAIVALRVLYLTVFIAFVIDLIIVGPELIKLNLYKIIAFIVANIVLIVHTYYCKTKTALFLFMLFLFLWIILFIPCFGWSAGLQNYFILVLMLLFFASYGKPVIKFVNAGFVLLIRVVTILLFGKISAQVEISLMTDKMLQITNITAVFLGIIFISYLFSAKDNEAEGKLMRYNDMLKKEAYTDQLTGLYNRRRAKEVMMSLIEEVQEHPISIAIGDIDFFKKVNDTYGHDVGDEVLKAIANLMTESVEANTFIARWGGEEFLIVFSHNNGDEAYIILEELRRKIQSNTITIGEHKVNITMTFGVAEYDFNSDMEMIIKEADDKLYQGKQSGRNRVVF